MFELAAYLSFVSSKCVGLKTCIYCVSWRNYQGCVWEPMNSPGLNSTRSRVDWIIGRRGTYVESRMDTIILSPGTVYTFDRLNKQGETNHWGLTICMQYSETKFIFSTLYRFDSLILSCWMKIQWTATFKDFLIIHFNVHKFTYITFTVATAIRNHYSHAPDWAEGGVGRREDLSEKWS